jgi:signal transduction histidine kinase/CheY-like chemotaxis protein
MAVILYGDLLDAYHSEASLDDLRQENLTLLVFAAVVGAAVLGLVSLPAPMPELARAWAIVFGLCVTAALTDYARAFGLRVGSAAMIGGLLVVATAAIYLYHERVPVGGCFALVALAASVLLGWRWGATTGLAGTSILLTIVTLSPQAITASGAIFAIFLIWGGVILAWLLSRPTQLALDWSWHSYVQALQKTEELRDHQAELSRLSKSLSETCERLELLNQELERARQSAEDARKLKSEFAATVSHELRTPLNLIIGFSEMLIRHLGAKQQIMISRDELETIHRNASHISTMVDDILDLAQLEVHRMALHRERANLPSIVAEATSTMASMVKRAGLDLHVELKPDLPEILIDRTRVRQILINLLSNAVRSTDEGRVTIGAHCVGGDIVVSVADTGAGIIPENLPRLFDDFSRVDVAGPRRGRSGLGLAVSKRFAELHGGNMWVESVPGDGSTFFFSLPICDNVITVASERDWQSLVGGVQAQVWTVVVLGRNPEGARIFQRYLDGCQVLAASNTVEAERLSREQPVHALVFTDPLPSETRPQLEGPAGALPVFVCPLRTLATRLDPGAAECLVKPVTHQQVADALRRLGSGVRELLIIDDDPEMVKLLAEMVRAASRHYKVRTAEDGAAGLVILREHQLDAVLLDLLMPGMDGYQVLESMRADPRLSQIPVVVVTARGQHSEVVRADGLNINRPGGLGIGEVVGCVKASLDSLLAPSARSDLGPEQPEALLG